MSNKTAKIFRKRIKAAADVYWTEDMAKMLRRIRRERSFWMCGALLAIIVDIGWILHSAGVF
jgi:hypothetical protein